MKATEDQKEPNEEGPVTELPEKDGKPTAKEEDFEGTEDEDAIEALEEMARSSQPEKSQSE